MKKLAFQLTAVTAIIAMSGISYLALAEENDGEDAGEKPVAMEMIPAPVMTTAKSMMPGAAFSQAVLENEDGRMQYEIKMKTADGRMVEVMVRPDGQFVETEEQVSESTLPTDVGATLKAVLSGGETKELEKKMIVVYEVKKEVNGKTYEMMIDNSGKILSLDKEHGEWSKEKGEKGENKGEHEDQEGDEDND